MDSLKPPKAWQAARRILAVRLDNMGDVLMTTPALRALRQSGTDRHITLLAAPAGAAVAAFIPEIDDVIRAELPWLPGAPLDPAGLQNLADTLRGGEFDAAVIFTVYSQNPLPAALLCWLAGIPLRLAHCRENPYHLLSDWIPDPEPQEQLRHEVRRQLDLVAAVGCAASDEGLSFRVRSRDRAHALAKLVRAGGDPARQWVVVHPGASAPSRRYPTEHFAAVIDELAGDPDCQLLITGDAGERDLIAAIRARSTRPTISLMGMLTLGELGAMIGEAALLIANNTGPVHLAAALGTPVVDLYALTNPQHAPWQVPNRVLYHDVPCRFCYRSTCPQGHHDCLRRLDPERVAAAARELLEGGAERCPTIPAASTSPATPATAENRPCTPSVSMPPTTTAPPAWSATAK